MNAMPGKPFSELWSNTLSALSHVKHLLRALAAYDVFFARPDLPWVELIRDIVELAAAIRAWHCLSAPDALQAASCLQLVEHLFLIRDKGFKRVIR